MTILEKIKLLEKESKTLEPDRQTRNHWQSQTNQYVENFLERRKRQKAYEADSDNGLGLLDSPIGEEGIDIEEALSLVKTSVDLPGIEPTSSRFFGYIPGGALYPSALGDFLAAIANKYAGVFFASPGSVRLENMLIRWVADLMGYPDTAAGNLSSGGSIAHLIGITAARAAYQLKARDFHRAVVYLSAHTHHCVTKALKVAGMEDAVIRQIPLDESYRMKTDGLPKMIEEDRAAGLIPFILVASAGTTDVGAIDPLNKLADICEIHKVWYTIDGAYGGFYILCEEVAEKMKGIERSDALVIDPHKGLFLPYGTGTVLVRDRKYLLAANSAKASYMQDTVQDEELDPANLSPELTKHFRGLRMWLPLKLFGLKPFRAALTENVYLARYFYQEIQKISGFEVGPFPDISVVLFRYMPKQGDVGEFNKRLVNEIMEDGTIFLSSTTIDGVYYLRLAVCVYRTHLEDVGHALNILKEKVAKLEESYMRYFHEKK